MTGDRGPTVNVTVLATDHSASPRHAWFDADQGTFGGDTQVCAAAEATADTFQTVDVFGLFPATASTGSLAGGLAALMAFKPGRTIVTACPHELSAHLDRLFADKACGDPDVLTVPAPTGPTAGA